MAGQIILYSGEREDEFKKIYPSGMKSDNDRTVTVPKMGMRWAYFKQTGGVTTSNGNVIHIDKDSGVVCTDAGEIFVRG